CVDADNSGDDCDDCAGVPNGNTVCLNLGTVDEENGTMDILYQSYNPISCFQFDLSNIIITDAESSLEITVFDEESDLIIGLSTTGSVLPPTTGDESNILVVLDYLSLAGLESCLSNAIIAYSGSSEGYPVSYTNDSSLDSVCFTPCMNSGCGCDLAGPSGCDNTCGSTLEIDDCGVCGGDNADQDCAGECGGSAWESDCGCVASDNSGDDCDDCAGEPNGTAWESDCGCVASDNSGDDCDDCAGEP
ncbi:uncharacterized protein METZ01_LOCUS470769, partial [marine metagenome]